MGWVGFVRLCDFIFGFVNLELLSVCNKDFKKLTYFMHKPFSWFLLMKNFGLSLLKSDQNAQLINCASKLIG